MDYLVICSVAIIISGITLFSGFGLGTVLMPTFALFFPIPVAVAATAVVHLANNLFKAFLVGRNADWKIVFHFSLPASIAALLGAFLLLQLEERRPWLAYQIDEQVYEITLLKLLMGSLIIFFGFFELLPRFQKMAFDRKYIPMGGYFLDFSGVSPAIRGLSALLSL